MAESASKKTQCEQESELISTEDLSNLQFRALNQAMQDALGQGRDPTQKGLQLWIATRKALQQFGLHQTYSEAHILNTAYLRGIKAIAAGKCIVSPYGWLRSAAYNYIRECSRAQNKTVELQEWHTSACAERREDTIYATAENTSKLEIALQKLSSFEQKLIILKVVRENSWKTIQKILEMEGLGTHQISTLRKQKSRALAKLRKYYQAL